MPESLEALDEQQKQNWVESILSMLGPSEAEAGTIGKAFKTALKPALEKAAASSAEKHLIGTKFKGAIIERVLKGNKPNLRYIVTNDGFTHPVTKDVVSDLVKAAGTVKYTTHAASQPMEGQLAAAYKSLDFHLGKARDAGRLNPYLTREQIRSHFRDWRNQLKTAGVEVPPTSLVVYTGKGLYKGKSFTMPTFYAEILEKEGVIKIVERMK